MINLYPNICQPIKAGQMPILTSFVHSKDSQLNQLKTFELIDNPSNRVFVDKKLLSFKGKTDTVLDSAIANIKATSGDKQAKEVLVNILTQMNRTIEFVENYNSPASDIESFGYSMSQKDREFADQITDKYFEKTGHTFYPAIFLSDTLDQIASEAGYHLDELSEIQLKELNNNYDNYLRKESLKTYTIQLLNHNKDLPEFKPFIKQIERIVDDFENRVLLLGLSAETKSIVEGLNRDLGVKVDMPDLPDVARFLDSELRRYKHPEINFDLPERITLNNFNNFATADEKNSIACFYYPCAESVQTDISMLHFKLNGVFETSKIDFNPFLLHQSLDDNNELKPASRKEFSDDLRHELGHFWHFKNIGLENFFNNDKDIFNFKDEEIELIDKFRALAAKIEPNWPEGDNFNINILVEYYETIHNIEEKKIQFDPQFLKDLKPVIDKIDHIIEAHAIIKEEFPSYYKDHATSSVHEMIAFAVQLNNYVQYSDRSEAFFAKHGMPKMKDRCLIVDRETYLTPQPEPDPVLAPKQTGSFLNRLKKLFH